ncbi:hypothetical protein AMECASPLE_000413 [Ameca splendens]|uniref:Uncharacterized protein n=1 Tax=Ameca splendens TaxID=208324 RepID=A0ABV0XAQ7_9TELE
MKCFERVVLTHSVQDTLDPLSHLENKDSFSTLGCSLLTTAPLSTRTSPHKLTKRLRKFGISPKILRNFYTCVNEGILTSCLHSGTAAQVQWTTNACREWRGSGKDQQNSAVLSAEILPLQSPKRTLE